jgi:hypothetical protein
VTPARLLTRPGADRHGASTLRVADIERFWPSRRGDAFDELCR